jgi:hypothetical protein
VFPKLIQHLDPVRSKGGQGGENKDVTGEPERIIPHNHIGGAGVTWAQISTVDQQSSSKSGASQGLNLQGLANKLLLSWRCLLNSPDWADGHRTARLV